MPSSFVVTIANKNYADPQFWLPAEAPRQPQTPKYSPDCADLAQALAHAGSFTYKYDSTHPPHGQPSFEARLLEELPVLSDSKGGHGRVVFELQIDKLALLPVRPGGWFSQAAFSSAYQSHGAGWSTGPGTVTWEELFGSHGILGKVWNDLAALSGVKATLQLFGGTDAAMPGDAGITIAIQVSWPGTTLLLQAVEVSSLAK